MQFTFFDPEAGIGVSHRALPHWFQAGACYFVTFRTADSLPAAVVERWVNDRRRWLASHGIDPNADNWFGQLSNLPQQLQTEYHQTFAEGFQRFLDAGYGECILRRQDASKIVADALTHFDGKRYHLSDFVVMPNHVHVLFGLLGDAALAKTCYSWKKYTANEINRLLGRSGHFWQGESFDHIVRSGEQFEYLRAYIAANPKKAGQKPGEFMLYQAEL